MSKPIHDPHAGQLQVVVSFRVPDWPEQPEDLRQFLEAIIRERNALIVGGEHDLDVAVRVIGDGGEASEDEGRYDAPRHHTTRDKEDIDPKGRL